MVFCSQDRPRAGEVSQPITRVAEEKRRGREVSRYTTHHSTKTHDDRRQTRETRPTEARERGKKEPTGQHNAKQRRALDRVRATSRMNDGRSMIRLGGEREEARNPWTATGERGSAREGKRADTSGTSARSVRSAPDTTRVHHVGASSQGCPTGFPTGREHPWSTRSGRGTSGWPAAGKHAAREACNHHRSRAPAYQCRTKRADKSTRKGQARKSKPQRKHHLPARVNAGAARRTMYDHQFLFETGCCARNVREAARRLGSGTECL